LKELATKHLHSEVTRSRTERSQNVHLQEDIPETPPAEAVSTLGEEVLDFCQPDEDLKLEDIFPDEDIATPEDFVVAKEQLLRCVSTALPVCRDNGAAHCDGATLKDSAVRTLRKCSTRPNQG